MNDPCEALAYLPRWQREIHARCVHPSGTFVEFASAQIEESIPRLFEQQVLKHSHKLAVRTEQREFTYAELNDKANAIAAAVLEERGETSEGIALLLEHDAAAIAAIVGVLKAGKICVPLDAGHPRTRLDQILSDSGAALILSSQRNLLRAREIAGSDQTVMSVDALGPGLGTDNPNLSISPDQLAYIIYTSGSTGPPKGVTHSHRNILNTVRNHTNWFHICAEDRVGLLFSLGAMGAPRDTFGALLNGAALFPFDVKRHTMTQLAKWLMNEQITTFRSVTTVFRHFASALTEHESFPNLRLIHAGTEMVYKSDVELYRRYFPEGCVFTTGLGATELSPITSILVDHGNGTDQGIVSGGYPVDGVEVKLLGDDGNEVGSNEVGEIVVRSRYLSTGYWRRPEMTNAAFATDPDEPDVRLYRTGDLGRLLPDGRLVLLGRKDAQVKIRGHRVELAEVEAALLEVDGVAEAVVAARADGSGDQRLVAYFVPSSQPAPTVSSLRRALSDRMPNYMLPSVFMALDTLPLTPNGKVDRLALPEPDPTRPALAQPYQVARTPAEVALAEIWADVLHIDRVGAHDDFLELGGHSLAASQIISRAITAFGFELSVQELFGAPTVADMALVVIQGRAKQTEQKKIERILSDVEQISDGRPLDR